MAVMLEFSTEAVTVMFRLLHDLPPLPLEVEMSKVSGLQRPMEVGSEIKTTTGWYVGACEITALGTLDGAVVEDDGFMVGSAVATSDGLSLGGTDGVPLGQKVVGGPLGRTVNENSVNES